MEKNVLMVLDHEFPRDQRVENEISVLISSGFTVHVCCCTTKGLKTYEECNDGKLIIHRKKISAFIYKSSVAALSFPFYFSFWRKFLKRICKEYEFRAIHSHDLPMAKVGLDIAKREKIPFVLDLHENWPELLAFATHTNTILGKLLSNTDKWRKFETSMINQASVVLSTAEEMKSRFLSITSKENESKIFVYQNVPDISVLPSLDKIEDSNEFRLFYAGGINITRGLQTVIKAISLLSKKGTMVNLYILGKGSYEQDLKNLAQELNVSNRIKFLGWGSTDDVMRQLSKANAAIIPHYRTAHNDNTSPNKIFQYMFSRTPAIVSDCLYLKRIVNQYGCGKSYLNSSSEDLADQLEWCIKNPDDLMSMGKNGYNAVKDQLNVKIEGKNIIAAYNYINLN